MKRFHSIDRVLQSFFSEAAAGTSEMPKHRRRGQRRLNVSGFPFGCSPTPNRASSHTTAKPLKRQTPSAHRIHDKLKVFNRDALLNRFIRFPGS
jgi:hypothetical protein